MVTSELSWIVVYIIAIGIAGGAYLYWHRQADLRFLQRLVMQLRGQHKQRKPLSIKKVPFRYIPLYLQLQKLLELLPPPTGRDKLTGLLNRTGLKSRLIRRMPITQGMFVLIDIYRFRYVNDLFGFSFGDEFLLSMAQRLQAQIGASDILARMNEDEFLIFYYQSPDETQLNVLQQTLQQPFKINDTTINPQIQMGYLDLSIHYSDVSQMLRRLDLAMVRAKASSNLIASYQAGDDVSQHRQLTIISCFPKALKSNELYLVYQPKLTLDDGACHHVEALVRWNSKQLGMLSPGEFIPLLECAGMINMLSQWVIEQAVTQLRHWQDKQINLQIAVNLAIDDLSNKHLCQSILSQLKRHNLSSELLTIEVTESQLMTDMSRAVSVLNQLRDAGINIAIDDFGTGHSSLAYLKHLPVDEVKIDKAFLTDIHHDLRGQHILRSAIDLAKGLGIRVTVEGVETPTTLTMLKKMAVDTIQGEIFAKPMTAAELETNWDKLRD